MIKQFQNSMLAWRLRKIYRKQKHVLHYILEKSVKRQQVPIQKELFRRNLVILHDVLERSALSGNYWVWGGLLIGWAREGQILSHDYDDADFAYFAEDREKFLQAVECIVQAGFQPWARWINNNGEVTEYTFIKDGAKFEFWEMYKKKDMIWFYAYSPEVAIQTANAIPTHGLASMELLGRTWLKPDDHDTHLTAIYGNWRKPDTSWDYLEDDRSILEKIRWVGTRDHSRFWVETNLA